MGQSFRSSGSRRHRLMLRGDLDLDLLGRAEPARLRVQHPHLPHPQSGVLVPHLVIGALGVEVLHRLHTQTPRTGRPVVAGRDQLSADQATEQERDDLSVPVGSLVLRGRNWFLDADGAVVEYGESVARASRWSTHEYEITR